MLKYIEEFEKYVGITGVRNVKIRNVEEFLTTIHGQIEPNLEAQFFDARFVATWEHLYFAAVHALVAFDSGQNISKNLAMETMLYASAQRQIRKSMEFLGIKPCSSSIAVLLIGNKAETVKSAISSLSKNLEGQRDDTVLELSEEKMGTIKETFGVSDIELKAVMKGNALKRALIDTVIERMALLTTQL